MLCKFIYAAYRNMTKHTLISYELCEKNIILVQIPMFFAEMNGNLEHSFLSLLNAKTIKIDVSIKYRCRYTSITYNILQGGLMFDMQ